MTEKTDVPLWPSKWYVLVEIMEPPRQTRGGIALPDEVIKAQQLLCPIAKVLKLGPLAFKARTQAGMNYEDDTTNAKPGDYVFVGAYTGRDVQTLDGRKFKFVNDYELIGGTDSPKEFIAYV